MTFDATENHVQPFVYETAKSKSLHFSIAEIQSSMNLAQPEALDLDYTRTMMGFLLFHPRPLQIAMIGLGGGSLAKFCHRHLPAAAITVVEINPHVIALRDEFAVPPDDGRFRVVRGDGARFVRTHREAFDVLLVDGYDYEGLPAALSSSRFYDAACSCLRPAGMMVANLHLGHVEYPLLVERIARAFDGAALAVADRDKSNGIVFARRDARVASGTMLSPKRPATLDNAQWKLLQAEFARIRNALKEQEPTS